MKTAAILFKQAPKINQVLKDHAQYWAHLPGNDSNVTEETLDEHVELVNEYAQNLIEAHGLDAPYNSLCAAIAEQMPGVEDKAQFSESLKLRSIYSIVFHDFGKVNPNFQRERMKNTEHFNQKQEVPFFPAHGHSELSAFLYNTYFLRINPLNTQEGQLLAIISLLLSFPILQHHAKGLYKLREKYEQKENWHLHFEQFAAFERYFGWEDQGQPAFKGMMCQLKKALQQFWKVFDESFALYALIKLNFSLLTSADYLATSDYMNQQSLNDFGIITPRLKAHIIEAAGRTKPYNGAVFQALSDDGFQAEYPQTQGNQYLNQLRKEMAVDALRALKHAEGQRLFYLEAPTGGGKTNISMLAAAELLKQHPELNKIMYVFPFTTLVTQTFDAILETYDLTESEVAQIHAKAAYRATQDEGDYGTEKTNYLHNLFYHYPISLLTHIRFFDWLKTNFKEANYPFHRLANTIVIIDELQSYDPKHWDKIIYLLEQYARHFNTYFLLMSATLPKLGDLLQRITRRAVPIHHLLPKAKEHFFQNPNFNRRVSFDFSLLSKTIEQEELLENVLNASKAYALHNEPYPGSVHTIVEFIFKRSASDFYSQLQKAGFPFFDEIFVLSGTILEPRRKEVINHLKNPVYRSKKTLLITTQVVEAGVDIDMDIGFKDASLIDSDEQLAGRINRNVKKRDCKLFLFRMDKASILYQSDLRYQQVRNRKISLMDYRRILQEKDFDHLYKLVFQELADWNAEEMAKGFHTYREHLKKLRFEDVHHEFRLIEQENIAVFVPLNIPLSIAGSKEGTTEAVFSKDELDFLAQGEVLPVEGYINGGAVFDLYIRIVQNQEGDYVSRVVSFKRMQSILSKFVFSVFASQRLLRELKRFARYEHTGEEDSYEEYGYLYLSNYEAIYDYVQGLNEAAFEEAESQIM